MFADNSRTKLEEIRKILRASNEWHRKAQIKYPPLKYLGQMVSSQLPVIVMFPVKGAQPYPHFNSARAAAGDWLKQNPNSTDKPRIFYFDFDKEWWEAATNW